MNPLSMPAARAAANNVVRIGLIRAGKFGSVFLAQIPSIAGIEIAVIADLDPERARAACGTVRWDASRIAQEQFCERGSDACIDERVEVVAAATGSLTGGIPHALAAIEARKHVVMANVEADALAGALPTHKARAANVIYSMAYSDRPALMAEMVGWVCSTDSTVAAE
jgi:predicted homoserine dehydrogenase-like protein